MESLRNIKRGNLSVNSFRPLSAKTIRKEIAALNGNRRGAKENNMIPKKKNVEATTNRCALSSLSPNKQLLTDTCTSSANEGTLIHCLIAAMLSVVKSEASISKCLEVSRNFARFRPSNRSFDFGRSFDCCFGSLKVGVTTDFGGVACRQLLKGGVTPKKSSLKLRVVSRSFGRNFGRS